MRRNKCSKKMFKNVDLDFKNEAKVKLELAEFRNFNNLIVFNGKYHSITAKQLIIA